MLKKISVPVLNPLTEEKENILEKKLVWVFGSPRSGTTWFALQLLKHKANVHWDEPFIGWHLDANREFQRERGDYFFSDRHKKNWLPALRKLILARAYSHAQTVQLNVIIKEPNGSCGADRIIECVPNSKMIFVLRDGRDVVDSLIDAHRPDSWHKRLKPLLTQEMREEKIKQHSKMWKKIVEIVIQVYNNHPPELRHMLKYEELKKDTFTELKKMYEFLGISIEDEEIQKIVDKYQFDKIPDSEKGPGKFIRIATPGAWKDHFNEKEQDLMHSIMSKTLQKWGYEV